MEIVNVARSFLTYITVGIPGFGVLPFGVPRVLSLLDKFDILPSSVDSVLYYFVGLAVICLLTGHIIASGWNKAAGGVVASAEYLYSGYLIWDQWGHQKISALVCLLFLYAVCAFLFVKFQKETKFGREYFKWGSLVVFGLLIAGYVIPPHFVGGWAFVMYLFLTPGALLF